MKKTKLCAMLLATFAATAFANEGGQEVNDIAIEPQVNIVKVPVEAKKVKEKIIYATNSPFEYINELAKENGFKILWRSSLDVSKLKGDLKSSGILTSKEIWLDRILSTLNLVNDTEMLSHSVGNALKLSLCDKNRLVIYNYELDKKNDKGLKHAFCHTVENKEQVKFYLDGEEIDIKEAISAEKVQEIEKRKLEQEKEKEKEELSE